MARARARSRYVCQECGAESAGWLGRCPGCGSWNTLVEERVPAAAGRAEAAAGGADPLPLADVTALAGERVPTGLADLDRVLGGGLVVGSLVLVGGDPGIGKSTLLLQVARHRAAAGERVLYVAGEESAAQVRLRADRLGPVPPALFVLAETDLEPVLAAAERLAPALLVVDSVHTLACPGLESPPGSVAQVREAAAALLRLAKGRGLTTFLIGHINKEGALAGPKVLEHLVDAVLYLEGERHHAYRLLRGVKNRFGPTSEVGVFVMGEEGLEPVPNPSELFLAERAAGVAGSVVVAAREGVRPLLVEVQALLAGPVYGTPRRAASGVDLSRLALLLAVLERRAGLGVGNHDAYVKVVGGLRLEEPAADLGVALALASAFRGQPVDPGAVVLGEVGLGGEVRAVAGAGERVAEAARLGFRRCLLPAANRRSLARAPAGLELVGVATVAEAMAAAFASPAGAP